MVSVLLAVAFVAVPYRLASEKQPSEDLVSATREEARAFLVRNPQLEVDALGELILDPTWLVEMRTAAVNSDSDAAIQLPARMLSRLQARLDGLITQAFDQRINEDPAWRFGVLDARSPPQNYFIHAFVHENTEGLILSAMVLLFVGAMLELTWGSLIFSVFAIVAIPMTAQAYLLFDASSGIPWSGAAGLAGALLGAYFIRGLGGHFAIPGWVVLPAWIAAESVFVRGFWIDELSDVPWATFCAAVAIGALAAGALRLANVETHTQSRAAKRAGRRDNLVVARALRIRSDGDPYQAFDLIQAGWRDDPKNPEVVEAFFSIAMEVGQPEAAIEAIMPTMRDALRSGDLARALYFWLPIASKGSDVPLEPTTAVRLGEALLDAGHPTEAIFTFRSALEAGASAAQAVRIVRVARDLDVDLARQAATVALNDASLNPRIRAEIEPIMAVPNDSPPTSESAAVSAATDSDAQSLLDLRAQAEHQSIDVTTFPLDADSDLEADHPGDRGEHDANEAILRVPSLDTGAFSADSLSNATNDATVSFDSSQRESLGETFDMDLDVDFGDSLLEPPDDIFDLGTDPNSPDLVDPREEETDRGDTNVSDATEEIVNPLGSSETPDENEKTLFHPRSEVVFDQATMFIDPPGSGGAQSNDPMGDPTDPCDSSVEASLRPMKALDAIPIETGDDWIEIDASPRGKSKIPFSRIQSISMAAVSGLGNRSRPVLIVDVILNGVEGLIEPMKLIRFRSDRFNPLDLAPESPGPLRALVAWVNRLQSGSNAICRPSRKFLSGEFTRHLTLEAYERDVLGALRDTSDDPR